MVDFDFDCLVLFDSLFGMESCFLDCAITVLRGFAYVFGPCKSINTSVLWHQMAPLKLMEGARVQCVTLLDGPLVIKDKP